MENMFCRQCEQTAGGNHCGTAGVCGKTAQTSAMQDLLIHYVKGIAFYGNKARGMGIIDEAADNFIVSALFTTVTNVNFDDKKIAELVKQAEKIRDELKSKIEQNCADKKDKNCACPKPSCATDKLPASYDEMFEQAKLARIDALALNADINSLKEILLYGLKGMAAYADHALILGKRDETVMSFFHKGLALLADDKADADKLLSAIIEFGLVNLKCMENLDGAHTGRYGHPEPAKVPLGHKKGPGIVVSGHDLLDLEQLLIQTEGKGISIYTHGEMLPAHGYPKLRKYKHLAGHYGTAWQNQQKEFADFPGAVLMTTNCIQKPSAKYEKNIFTTGLVRWPGVSHITAANGKKDFSEVIKRAVELKGFDNNTDNGYMTTGFARNAVLAHAGAIVELVKTGKIKHFFLVGGCDGAKPGRNYFTDFVQKTPKDTIVLTLACGKFRFNTLELGDINGIPRLLDMGQCNDAYSAIVVASELAKAFNCGVNDLPLSLVLSWYEQKAVCILLTLFALGIKNIRLGPSLPAFVSSNVLKVLVEKFAVKPITTAEKDLSDILQKTTV